MSSMSTMTEPPLTTGWEPDLPDSDSMALGWLRHWSDLCAGFAAAAGGTISRDERYVLADYGRPASYFNAAVLLAPQPEPGALEALLDEIESRAAGGTGDVYLWSLWPTPDLGRRGWQLDGHPPLLARPPVAVAPAPQPTGPLPQRVRTAAGLADWERVLVEGYPMPDLHPDRQLVPAGALIHPGLLDDERVRFWSAVGADGSAVSISAQSVSHGLASFALGATLPAARRSGHWSRHARVRLQHEPGHWHVGAFSDDSRSGAERLGFVPVLRHPVWHLPR